MPVLASDVVSSAFVENIPLCLEFAALAFDAVSSAFAKTIPLPVASFILEYPELGFLSKTHGWICFTTTKIYTAKLY